MMKTLLFFLLTIAVAFSIYTGYSGIFYPPIVEFTNDTEAGNQTDDNWHIGVTISGADVAGENVIIYIDGDATGIPFDECVMTDPDLGIMTCTIDIPITDGEHTAEACATETWGLTTCITTEPVDFGERTGETGSSDWGAYRSRPSTGSAATSGAAATTSNDQNKTCCIAIGLIAGILLILGDRKKKR